MPELPEVETICRGLYPHLKHQIINNIIIRHTQLRYPLSEAQFAGSINLSIVDIIRRGKYLILLLTEGYLLIHLGMSGHLKMVNKDEPPKKHDHVDLVLKNGFALRYNDPRRFGLWLYNTNNPLNDKLLMHLGPEPLSSQFNTDYLWQKIQGKSQPIKSFIMDNKIVVGVGNIYATESLFMAKIHPLFKTGLLSLEQVENLVQAIKYILSQAILAGGTTLQDFFNIEGKPGYFVNQLLMYGRNNKPCFNCHQLIQQLKISGRNSTFCAICQVNS